ncbi:acyl-CoA/acyl-ACP dehydrogenase [Rhizorhabdus wittichii]|uniref:Acyl-CoA/acyl-ACP dehydrogenase n=1 Tax=Rhizorhabdus wittichii TaxID=160791 RepID=A0A975HDK4_9SPHN|nr:acyl-CoA dehydrogenase family protein [Rhizorhabdus wittichii]QTH21358.1 acyl-CoA/acyl-ACP dehydrogenase [Rhizorhabdus wittichii]
MDLDFSEEQVMLRDTARRLCESLFDTKTVRRLEGEPDKFNRAFWAELGASGLCALRIGEAQGGAGMAALDLAILFEEFGRSLASSPFLQSCVLSARILSAHGTEAIKAAYLPKIASGELIMIPAGDGIDPGEISIDAGRGTVGGRTLLTPFASVADIFLVHDGRCWALVPADGAGISLVPQSNYASQPLFSVRFDAVAIDPALAFAAPDRFDPTADAASDLLIAAAAEAVGAADRLLGLTVDYANQRSQFGRPIAAFQAISHPLADGATELEGVRHLVYQAAWASDEGMACGHLARMAKLRAAALFRRIATIAVQVHGGIGYSTEGEPQLFYRRSKYHELMNGTADALKTRIADHVLA